MNIYTFTNIFILKYYISHLSLFYNMIISTYSYNYDISIMLLFIQLYH